MEIQSLDLDLESDPEPDICADESLGFWRRQFLQRTTKKQNIFDWSYGVAIPLICVAADPIVFTDEGLMEAYRPFAHSLSAASILAMAAWLLWGERLRWLAAPLAGFFFAGSGVSLLVAALLFPYSLLGLFFLIGFLGFTPIFSALVFLRNGIRAYRTSSSFLEPRVVWQSAALAAGWGLVIPYLVNVYLAGTSSYTSILMR